MRFFCLTLTLEGTRELNEPNSLIPRMPGSTLMPLFGGFRFPYKPL